MLKRPQIIQLIEPSEQWKTNATSYVEQSHKELLLKKDILASLAARGLSIEVVQQYRFGWSSKDQFLSRADWGLEEQFAVGGKPRKLWIPKGLVIPVINSTGQIIRLKVRRPEWKNGDELPKYVAISGSMN